MVAEEKMRLLKEKEKKMEDLRREKDAAEMLGAKIKNLSILSHFGFVALEAKLVRVHHVQVKKLRISPGGGPLSAHEWQRKGCIL